jgi:hypothetical protein
LKYHKEVEYRSYGLYSDVAKQTGYTATQVDAVYSWYLNKTMSDLVDKPTCQIFLKGLGMLQISLPTAVNTLNKTTLGVKKTLEDYLNGTSKEYVSVSFLDRRVSNLLSASASLKQRATSLKSRDIINDTLYINKITRIESIESTLKQLYESIQRIPEYEQKRTPECRQSTSWSDEQDSEPISIIEQ